MTSTGDEHANGPVHEVQQAAATTCAGLASGERDHQAALMDRDVVAFGLAAHDVFSDREALSAAGPTLGVPILAPSQIRVGLAEGGCSGWFWALSSEGGESGAERQVRITGVAHRTEPGVWSVLQLHMSLGLPNDDLPESLGTFPPVAPLGERVTPDAVGLVELLHGGLGVRRLDLLARRPDVITIGTDPAEVWEGADAYLEVFEPMRDQIVAMEDTFSASYPSGTRARLSRDGQTGFVATTVDIAMGGSPLPSMRVVWVFTLIGGQFRLVCDHHSFPLRQGS